MKKLLAIALLPLLMLACKRDITSINVDPKNPQVAPGSAFFSNAQKNMADMLSTPNVNSNIFRLILQYWQETTYLDESQYDIDTRQNPRQLWNNMYRDVIRDIREAKTLIPQQENNAVVQKNQLAIAEIQEIFVWYYLVTTFGDIPYSEALNPEILQPKYDDQQEVYKDLLTRLDAAIGQLDPSAGSFGDADLLYHGDVEAWQKFANSFKLKMGMTIADVDPAKAQAIYQQTKDAVFESNADNAVFVYLDAPPNTNPIWVNLVQSGRKDFVAATTLIERMETLNDPRIEEYFTRDAVGGYSGGNPGEGSNYATFSKPSGLEKIFAGDNTDVGTVAFPNHPYVFLSYAEVEFYLAEAEQRWGSAVAAADHFYEAIEASITQWGGTTGEATAYKTGVVYNPTNWKQSIGEQKWIALYDQPWDAWIEWRRLDYPQLEKATDAVSDIPVRFTYPIPEQNVNPANYEAASTAIGGDEVTTKLFWDKF